ncbi:MAG: outer membrane beta-barrel protein [Gammaproteobacteria bacterium]|nr:outer membrane beta-barrel protein [Gammaproteobacteria bacterium]
MNIRNITLALLGLAFAGSAAASELSYTYVDFRVLNNELDLTGTDTPVPGQSVALETEDGDGISVAGSLQLPAGFYLAGAFNSSIVDVTSTITSPLTETEVRDEFDLITSSFGVGYRHELGTNFDLIGELTYDTGELDFGSLAGEDFDTEDSGVSARVGFRWNPRPPFELYALGGVSPVGEVSLNERRFDSASVVNAGFRWYFFQDLGFGLDYQSGDLSALTLSMRFSFGSVPW